MDRTLLSCRLICYSNSTATLRIYMMLPMGIIFDGKLWHDGKSILLLVYFRKSAVWPQAKHTVLSVCYYLVKMNYRSTIQFLLDNLSLSEKYLDLQPLMVVVAIWLFCLYIYLVYVLLVLPGVCVCRSGYIFVCC